MLIAKVILNSVVSIGLIIAGGEAVAQMSHDTPMSQTNQFRRIDQPLWVKGVVTTGGIALIGLEIWWFLLSKPKSQKAETHGDVQEVRITVDGGYKPNRIVVNTGQKVRLNFLRRDSNSCLEKVVFPDFHIAKELNLNQVTPVEFTPQKSGQYTFTCGMNMFRGFLEVKETGLLDNK